MKENCTKIVNLLQKYPNRCAIIAHYKNQNFKFLVPREITIGQFLCIIRKRIHLNDNDGIFVFIDNILPPTSENIGVLYEKFKHDDFILYIVVKKENTFGSNFIVKP